MSEAADHLGIMVTLFLIEIEHFAIAQCVAIRFPDNLGKGRYIAKSEIKTLSRDRMDNMGGIPDNNLMMPDGRVVNMAAQRVRLSPGWSAELSGSITECSLK